VGAVAVPWAAAVAAWVAAAAACRVEHLDIHSRHEAEGRKAGGRWRAAGRRARGEGAPAVAWGPQPAAAEAGGSASHRRWAKARTSCKQGRSTAAACASAAGGASGAVSVPVVVAAGAAAGAGAGAAVMAAGAVVAESWALRGSSPRTSTYDAAAPCKCCYGASAGAAVLAGAVSAATEAGRAAAGGTGASQEQSWHRLLARAALACQPHRSRSAASQSSLPEADWATD